MKDYFFSLVAYLFLIWCFTVSLFMVLSTVNSEQPNTAEADPQAPVAWTPCEAPRPDVECWRSGHTIACLPLTPEHPRNDQ